MHGKIPSVPGDLYEETINRPLNYTVPSIFLSVPKLLEVSLSSMTFSGNFEIDGVAN